MEKESVDYLWNMYNTVNEWIRFSDTKAGAVLVVNGLIATFFLDKSKSITELWTNGDTLALLLLLLSGITLCLSTGAAFLCLIPRLRVGEANSMLYYVHIDRKFDI